MPATPDIQESQFDVGVIADIGADLEISQFDAIALFRFPAEEEEVSQFDVQLVTIQKNVIQTSQLDLIILFRGRVSDPSVRAWTATLDGHDFYFLRLGNAETLVYDLTTEQWHVWASGSDFYWNIFTGINWFGGNNFSASFGSNIIVGSDANGSLFILDPTKPDDDPATEGRDVSPFRRRVTGQLPSRGYDSVAVYEFQLLGSIGQLNANADTGVTLLYSDDRGDSYVNAGEIITEEDNYEIRGSWRSLGSFRAPGRLFRVEDFGALQRIDSMTVNTSMAPE